MLLFHLWKTFIEFQINHTNEWFMYYSSGIYKFFLLIRPQILLYKVKSSGKFRKRSMPIRDLGKSSDCYLLAEKLKKRHEKYLNEIVAVRIEKLLRILQVTMTGESLKGALNIVQVQKTFEIYDTRCNFI